MVKGASYRLLAMTLMLIVQPSYGLELSRLNEQIHQLLQQQLQLENPTARGQFGDVTLHPALLQTLKHKPCQDYQLKTNPGRWQQRISVQVRCQTPPWSFYVMVTSNIQVPVLTPTRVIQRGEPLGSDNLQLTWMETTRLSSGYISQLEEIVQSTPRTHLQPGRPIYSRQLRQRHMVSKGDQVVIRAVIGSAGVSSAGIALADGKLGEQIAVRNNASQRVIKAWVWAPGTVGSRPQT